MLKLPKKYKDLEILLRRLILFTLSLGLIVVYAPQIIDFIARGIWICMPFIIGGLLAFILYTFSKLLFELANRFFNIQPTNRNRLICRILALAIVVGFVSILAVIVLPSMASSGRAIAQILPGYVENLYGWLLEKSVKLESVHNWLLHHQALFQDAPQLLNRLTSFLFAGGIADSVGNITSVISNTFSWLWTSLLSICFAIITFFNIQQFKQEAALIAKAYLPETRYVQFRDFIMLVVQIFSHYLRGSVLECIILGILTGLFSTLFRIPNAWLIGVFCGICALVPMFGATTGAIICTFFLFMSSPGKALTFIIMFICLQQVEGNFIYPSVVGKSVGLPPMYVVAAITVGASTAGILGMILSIPIASVIYALIIRQARDRMILKEENAQAAQESQETA